MTKLYCIVYIFNLLIFYSAVLEYLRKISIVIFKYIFIHTIVYVSDNNKEVGSIYCVRYGNRFRLSIGRTNTQHSIMSK